MSSPDKNPLVGVLPPDATPADWAQISAAHALAEMTQRMEKQEERGIEQSDAFVMIAFTRQEIIAFADLLQNERIPKELYDLAKVLKPKNFVEIRAGGQG